MLLAVIFLAFGILAWVAAGVVLYFRRRQLRKTDSMRRIETSRAADVPELTPGSPVEVKGTLRCPEPLEGEMSGMSCAYYSSRVIREYQDTDRDADGDTRTRRRSEVVASSEKFAPFAVEDASGQVSVRGEGADVDAAEVVNRFEKETSGSVTLGGLTLNPGTGERTLGYRYVESILPVDAPVYVLGSAGGGGIQAFESRDADDSFLISHRSEEQLEKKYRKDALTLALVALGLLLFGAAFVGVGAAAALGYL